MYYLGMLAYIYNMDEEIVQKEIIKTFGEKLKEDILAKNIILYHNGYQLAKEKVFFRVDVQSHKRPGRADPYRWQYFHEHGDD